MSCSDGPAVGPIPARFESRQCYRIDNLTRQTVLARSAKAACTCWRRAVGLLGKASMTEQDSLIFPACRSIHMWFMRMPIDVVAIDRQGRVVRCYPRLQPWQMTWPAPEAWASVELCPGAIAASATQPGDRLAITPIRQ